MCSALGGRAAEELIFGKISTGALSDLEKVTKQAYAMVSMYGLNKKVGNISFYDSQGQTTFTKPYSEETAKTIDQEVSGMIEEQYQRALTILTENKDKLIALANKLLEKEVIFKEDLIAVFGERPWEQAVEDGVSPENSGIVSETSEVVVDAEATTTDLNLANEAKKDSEDNSTEATDTTTDKKLD